MVRYERRKYLPGKIRMDGKDYYLLERSKDIDRLERKALSIEKKYGRGTVAIVIRKRVFTVNPYDGLYVTRGVYLSLKRQK